MGARIREKKNACSKTETRRSSRPVCQHGYLGEMESVPETGSKFSNKKRIFLIATNLLSLACLWWVLHDINWRESWVEIRQMNWWWVSLAVVSDVVVYVFHGWRWSLLLCPVESIPVMRSIRAIYVGLFANEVLPLRTGEVLRCYLQARWSSIPFSVTLASAFIERIFDGFWLVLCLFITVRLVPGLPRYVMDGAAVLGSSDHCRGAAGCDRHVSPAAREVCSFRTRLASPPARTD